MLVELVLIILDLPHHKLQPQLILHLTPLILPIPQVEQKEEEFFKMQQTQLIQPLKIFKIVHHILVLYV